MQSFKVSIKTEVRCGRSTATSINDFVIVTTDAEKAIEIYKARVANSFNAPYKIVKQSLISVTVKQSLISVTPGGAVDVIDPSISVGHISSDNKSVKSGAAIHIDCDTLPVGDDRHAWNGIDPGSGGGGYLFADGGDR